MNVVWLGRYGQFAVSMAPRYWATGAARLILVEVGGPGGLGGELYYILPAGLVGPAALGVFAGQDGGLLVAEGAGAGG